jgi:hypothetical protein
MSGKATIRQDIEQTRQNHPDTIASLGEFTDNSTSWGLSKKGSIQLELSKITIIDNGIFKKRRFSSAFEKSKKKEDDMEHYIIKNNEFGKYNYGLTDGTILFGNAAELYVKNENSEYLKNVFSITECIKENNYTSRVSVMTPEEINNFVKMQERNDPEYDKLNGHGTILTIRDLRKENLVSDFENIQCFMEGLYSPECHNLCCWSLFNWIDTDEYDKPKLIIEPKDLMFNCQPVINKTVFVYDKKGKSVFSEIKNKKSGDLIYEFKLKACFFEEENLKQEKMTFGSTLDRYRTGFLVRRGGRLLTGIEPKLWNLSTGMNHAKGFRVFIDLPVNPRCDKDWCVGTFKKITDDSWKNFSEEIKDFITNNFKDMVRLEEKDRKKKQKDFQDEYTKKLKDINKFHNFEDLINELKFEKSKIDNIIADKNDKRLVKSAGKSWNVANDYLNQLKIKIDSLKDPDPPKPKDPDPKPKVPDPKPKDPDPPKPKDPDPKPKDPDPKPKDPDPKPKDPDPPKPKDPDPPKPNNLYDKTLSEADKLSNQLIKQLENLKKHDKITIIERFEKLK